MTRFVEKTGTTLQRKVDRWYESKHNREIGAVAIERHLPHLKTWTCDMANDSESKRHPQNQHLQHFNRLV